MTRRLPETDLANLGFREIGSKRQFLIEWLKPKKLPPSYDPFRASIGEAVDAELPLFQGGISKAAMPELERLVIAACRNNPALIKQNMPPARALRDFTARHELEAAQIDVFPLKVMPGLRYSYGSPFVARYNGGAAVVFLDLRRSGGLTRSGVHFAQSVMHEQFRVANPDFESVRMEVWRFGKDAGRTIQPIVESRLPISMDEIVRDIGETYEVLNDIVQGEEYRSSGTAGSLI